MEQRQDAMVSAARIIQAVYRIARTTPGRQVATVGRLSAEPGAANVIPGRVRFSLEIRDLEMAKIDRVFWEIRDPGDGAGRERRHGRGVRALPYEPGGPYGDGSPGRDRGRGPAAEAHLDAHAERRRARRPEHWRSWVPWA